MEQQLADQPRHPPRSGSQMLLWNPGRPRNLRARREQEAQAHAVERRGKRPMSELISRSYAPGGPRRSGCVLDLRIPSGQPLSRSTNFSDK